MVNRAIPPGAGAVESGARADLDAIYAALSDPTRRAILAQLLGGAAVVGDLEAGAALSPAAISKHLKVLEQSGLVTRERQGRFHVLRVSRTPLVEAALWLEPFRARSDTAPAPTEPPAPLAAHAPERLARQARALVADLAPQMTVISLALGAGGHGADERVRFAARKLATRLEGAPALQRQLRDALGLYHTLERQLQAALPALDALREPLYHLGREPLRWRGDPRLRDVFYMARHEQASVRLSPDLTA